MNNIIDIELNNLKERMKDEISRYKEDHPEDIYLENFYSDEFVSFEDKYNLELMFWVEDNEIHIEHV